MQKSNSVQWEQPASYDVFSFTQENRFVNSFEYIWLFPSLRIFKSNIQDRAIYSQQLLLGTEAQHELYWSYGIIALHFVWCNQCVVD